MPQSFGTARGAAITWHVSRLLAGVCGAAVPLAWLCVSAGWPANHEQLRVFRRLYVLAEQWRLGQLFPVWSTTAFYGCGSASPILYHKAFTWISALIFLVTGRPKTAVCLTLLLVLVTLFLGVSKCCRILLRRDDLLIETSSAMLAVLAIYTTTDWLTRGAVAESAAGALVAWVFAWCLALIERCAFSRWIGPLMAAVYFAHPVLALYCALPLLLACGLAALRWRQRAISWIWPGLASLGICTALVAPSLVALLPYARFSSVDLLVGINPRGTHADFARLFHEAVWHWADGTLAVTIQIDAVMLLAGVLATAVIIARPGQRWAGSFLIAICTAMLVLQTSWALPFYDVVPGAVWIQFAFRLLTFLTIALALCAAIVLDRVRARLGAPATAAFCLVLLVAMSIGKPWLGHAPAPFYTDGDIADARYQERNATESFEYAPQPALHNLRSFFAAHAPSKITGECKATPLDDMTIERKTARFSVDCAATRTARLPIVLAPGMDFTVAGKTVPAHRTCPDALAQLDVPSPAVITATYPTFWRAIGLAFGAVLGRHDPAMSCA